MLGRSYKRSDSYNNNTTANTKSQNAFDVYLYSGYAISFAG